MLLEIKLELRYVLLKLKLFKINSDATNSDTRREYQTTAFTLRKIGTTTIMMTCVCMCIYFLSNDNLQNCTYLPNKTC